MRRVAHLSDLHFGRDDPLAVRAITDDLRAVGADLVVVSGDLTQRARRHQFAAARTFLDGLGIPWVAVPGNHDVPLFDVARRAVRPYGRYRRLVHAELEPTYQDDELAVMGLNTVQPSAWKDGAVRVSALARLKAWSDAAGDRARIVFAHHPFSQPSPSAHGLVRRWRESLQTMEEAGVDLVLTGHLHLFGHSETKSFSVDGPHRLIVVRASTAISVRRRGEPNSYNLLHIGPETIQVESRSMGSGRFEAGARHAYPRARRRDPGPQNATAH